MAATRIPRNPVRRARPGSRRYPGLDIRVVGTLPRAARRCRCGAADGHSGVVNVYASGLKPDAARAPGCGQGRRGLHRLQAEGGLRRRARPRQPIESALGTGGFCPAHRGCQPGLRVSTRRQQMAERLKRPSSRCGWKSRSRPMRPSSSGSKARAALTRPAGGRREPRAGDFARFLDVLAA